MLIDNQFELGQIVFLKTDKDQQERIITALEIRPKDCISYEVYASTVVSWHYDFEMTKEPNITYKTNG